MAEIPSFILEVIVTNAPTLMDPVGCDGMYVKEVNRLPSGVGEALRLWQEWFRDDGDPWEDDDCGATFCFFCGSDSQKCHGDECIFIRAKALVENVKP